MSKQHPNREGAMEQEGVVHEKEEYPHQPSTCELKAKKGKTGGKQFWKRLGNE